MTYNEILDFVQKNKNRINGLSPRIDDIFGKLNLMLTLLDDKFTDLGNYSNALLLNVNDLVQLLSYRIVSDNLSKDDIEFYINLYLIFENFYTKFSHLFNEELKENFCILKATISTRNNLEESLLLNRYLCRRIQTVLRDSEVSYEGLSRKYETEYQEFINNKQAIGDFNYKID